MLIWTSPLADVAPLTARVLTTRSKLVPTWTSLLAETAPEIDKALERNRSWLDAATLDRIAELRAGRASATTAKGGKR